MEEPLCSVESGEPGDSGGLAEPGDSGGLGEPGDSGGPGEPGDLTEGVACLLPNEQV